MSIFFSMLLAACQSLQTSAMAPARRSTFLLPHLQARYLGLQLFYLPQPLFFLPVERFQPLLEVPEVHAPLLEEVEPSLLPPVQVLQLPLRPLLHPHARVLLRAYL